MTVIKPSKPSQNITNGKAVLSHEALTYINQARAEKERAPIKWASELEGVALERAKEFSANFSHDAFYDRNLSGVGEIAAELSYSNNSAKAAINAWKKSPAHYISMTSSERTGVVVAHYNNYWVALLTSY